MPRDTDAIADTNHYSLWFLAAGLILVVFLQGIDGSRRGRRAGKKGGGAKRVDKEG